MKTIQDYVIGNTAVQIIHTGKRIKVVDVEKEKRRKKWMKGFCATVLTILLVFAGCFYVVGLQNEKVLLDEQVYSLQNDIEHIQKENSALERKTENLTLNYSEIFHLAKELGMRFPQKGQKYTYDSSRCTLVRFHGNGSGE